MNIGSFKYGDEILPADMVGALPESLAARDLAVWTLPWSELRNLRSPVYHIAIVDDRWQFPAQLFRPGSVAQRTGSKRAIEFVGLRAAAPAGARLDQIVRRAKRMAWIYLHCTYRQALTKVEMVNNFLAIIELLAQTELCKRRPGDMCPDGPTFFGDLEKEDFNRLVPVNKNVRDGIRLSEQLPKAVDDCLRFPVESYTNRSKAKRTEENSKNGLPSKAVSVGAIDDLNLSRLLDAANIYATYPDMLLSIATWIADHKELAKCTGKSTGIYKPCGKRQSNSQAGAQIRKELIRPNIASWRAQGIVVDDEGTLAVPIPQKISVYRAINELVDVRALRGAAATITYTNAVYLSFLTGMRDREISGLEFDPLVPLAGENGIYDQLIGYDLKTDDDIGGQVRDWPLPKAAVDLVIGTQKLHKVSLKLYGTPIPKHLFKWFSHVAASASSFLEAERAYSGPTDYILKRMRPSSAQLVADISRCPLAVQLVLGHTTIEQGLGYRKSRPDEDFIACVEKSTKARDRKMGDEMVAAVTGLVASGHMTRGVVRLGVGCIASMDRVNKEAAQKAKYLQSKIDDVQPEHFSEVYEMLGEDRDTVNEFIGESVAQPRPFQFCTAKKGGANFSGACSSVISTINPQKCKTHCPYNFETLASLELRSEWVERELARGHLNRADVRTSDPLFYNSVMKLLDWVNGFEGPLSAYRDDPRLLNIMERIAHDPGLVRVFKGEARRTLLEFGVES